MNSTRFSRPYLCAVVAISAAFVLIAGCRPTVSPNDAKLIHTAVLPYTSGPPAIGIGAHVEWALGSEAELDSDLARGVAGRQAAAEEAHRQIDSISNVGRLLELKEILHSIASKTERASVIYLQFIGTLARLDRANRANLRPAVDSLLTEYRNLFAEYNRLHDESVSLASRYNRLAANLALPDTVDSGKFRQRVTHQNIVEWFYIMADSTKDLILQSH